MKVIGVAGSEAKRCAVQALGAQHAINYRSEDVVARVAEITGGRGLDLILDPIGGKDFGRNFKMLAPLGMVVSYGRLDGPPDPGRGMCGEVADIVELAEMLAAFQTAQRPAGRRLAVITSSGGLAELILDVAAEIGIELPRLSPVHRRWTR